jgi:hypothetical protein
MHTFRSSSSTLARYKGQDESQSPNFLLVVPDAQDEKTTPNKIEESNSTQIIVTFFVGYYTQKSWFIIIHSTRNYHRFDDIPLNSSKVQSLIICSI